MKYDSTGRGAGSARRGSGLHQVATDGRAQSGSSDSSKRLVARARATKERSRPEQVSGGEPTTLGPINVVAAPTRDEASSASKRGPELTSGLQAWLALNMPSLAARPAA